MKWTKDGFELSSGRHIYANRQIVGINPKLDIHEGYDGSIWSREWDWDYQGNDRWTDVERRELADEMCRLWQQWAANPETP